MDINTFDDYVCKLKNGSVEDPYCFLFGKIEEIMIRRGASKNDKLSEIRNIMGIAQKAGLLLHSKEK